MANSGPLHAMTCAQDKNNLAQLNEQLKQDQILLSQWCSNSLSTQCKEQGPGMTQAITLLNEEITAAMRQTSLRTAHPRHLRPQRALL